MQMGIGRAGFYAHDWVERLMFRARYVAGRHSATRIHPELPPLAVGDTVPMGAGVFAPVSEFEPYRHLVAQETFVLRPLPGGKTRLITRYRGMGFVSPAARAVSPDARPIASQPLRRPAHSRRGPGSPRAGLLRRRPAAPLH
jgi:hypothetical protein